MVNRHFMQHLNQHDLIRASVARIIRNRGVVETDDPAYIRRLHERYMRVAFGEQPNLDDPQTFREKMVWLKLNYRDPLLTVCADKIASKDYIAQALGKNLTPATLRVFDDVENMDFTGLPDVFVLKNNHACGLIIIVRREGDGYTFHTIKNKPLSREEAVAALKKQLGKNYYYKFYEWQYKDIVPHAFAEEYLDAGDDLWDYKIFVNYGRIVYFEIVTNRATAPCMDAFDAQKRPIPVEVSFPRSKNGVTLPDNIDDMLDIAAKLGEPFPLVRVDLFDVNGRIYCGELTFTASGGFQSFYPKRYDRIMGELVDISALVRKKGASTDPLRQ